MAEAVLHHGDCLAVLPTLADGSADCVATDPPAGISFMGQGWDKAGSRDAFVDFLSARMAACLRVVRPGGYGLVWAIPRTSHWTATALEDAGWEIRDRIAHLFGTGFPKGQGCLKPACEDWWLVRRPGPKVLPLGIDECRVPVASADLEEMTGRSGKRAANNVLGQLGNGEPWEPTAAGRYPANVTHDGSDEVLEAFAAFGERSGPREVASRPADGKGYHGLHTKDIGRFAFDDTGSAARFFYAAKASKADRGEGNTHPTVKNTALMGWLVRLVCPPGGTVLDPFAGSGSTLVAAVRAGRNAVGIEKEAEYVTVARRRLDEAQGKTGLFAAAGG